jgi:hypothetical protein
MEIYVVKTVTPIILNRKRKWGIAFGAYLRNVILVKQYEYKKKKHVINNKNKKYKKKLKYFEKM